MRKAMAEIGAGDIDRFVLCIIIDVICTCVGSPQTVGICVCPGFLGVTARTLVWEGTGRVPAHVHMVCRVGVE